MKKSEATRRNIIENTIMLIAEKGYSGTSTKEISEKAGISEASIFRYFKSKDELLMTIVKESINEIYDYSIGEVLPVMDDAGDFSTRELTKKILLERFSFLSLNSNRVKLIFQEMLVNPEVRDYFKTKVWSKLDTVSKQILGKGIDSGEIRNIDPYFFQKILFGMMFHTAVFERVLDLDTGEYNPEQQVEMIIDLLFDGIGRSAG